jgi:hypothetical protein
MEVPKNIKDVQKLTGRLAALNKFILKSVEQSLPIFQALKGTKKTSYGDLRNSMHSKK